MKLFQIVLGWRRDKTLQRAENLKTKYRRVSREARTLRAENTSLKRFVDEIKKETVTGTCDICGHTSTMVWDVEELGVMPYCPYCGKVLWLCEYCGDRGACDYDYGTGICGQMEVIDNEHCRHH